MDSFKLIMNQGKVNQERSFGRFDLALIHYQFEAIHPFQDGNGRIGRLLFSLGLCAERVVHYPLLYLSEFIEKRKDEYYALLFNISVKGDWIPWIEFFLQAIVEQSKDAQA